MNSKILPHLIAAAAFTATTLSAQIIAPVTTTTYLGGGFTNTTSWSGEVLPVAPQVGLVALDGNMNGSLTNYRVVQTAGVITSGFNRTFPGTDWYMTGGELLFYSTGTASYTNLNNVATGTFNIYMSGGSFTAAAIKLQGGSLVHMEGGSVTATNSLQMQTGGILRFGPGSGSVTLAALQSDGTSVIDFLTGSAGSLTITGFSAANFENLWSQSILKVDGLQTGTFAGNFLVTDATLTLVPEPVTTTLLLGLAAVWLVLARRRKRA